jgi:hypothetical protein
MAKVRGVTPSGTYLRLIAGAILASFCCRTFDESRSRFRYVCPDGQARYVQTNS